MKINKYFYISLFLVLVPFSSGYAVEPVIGGTITETFDDNIFSNDEREWDFLTTVSLSLGLTEEGRRQHISFIGHINQNLYIRNFDQSNTSQDLQLEYGADLSENVSFALNDNFSHQPEPGNFEDQFGRINIRRSSYTNSLGTILNALMSRYFGITVRYVSQLNFAMTDLMDDSYQNGAGINFNFPIDSANTLYLVYDYLHSEYDNGDVIQTHTPGIGYTHYFTEQLHMILQGGLGCAIRGSRVDYSPNILAALVDDVDRNNTISLRFTFSNATGRYRSDIFENWQISANFTRQILERFSMAVNAFYGQGEYTSTGIKSDLAGFSLDFTYLLSEHMTVGTGYTFTYGATRGRRVRDTDYYRDQVRLLFTASL